MTLHITRTKTASGKRRGDLISIMAHLPADDFAILQRLAQEKNLPLTQILRDAVWAYVLPLKKGAA